MKLWVPVVALCLVLGCAAGDQEVKVVKTKPKRNGKVLLKGRCVFKISEKFPVGDAQFTLTMDTEISRFKSKQVTVISEDAATTWVLENAKVMKPTRFSVQFSGQYVGDADTPIPTGNCSDLRFQGTTTPEASTSTAATSSPTTSSTTSSTMSSTTSGSTSPVSTTTETPTLGEYSVAAEVEDKTSEGKCHVVEASCNLQVDATLEPGTVFFNLTFDRSVGRFQDNYGTYISQASEPGRWIYTSNRFQLTPPAFKYAFQINYHGDTVPQINCVSTLPPSGDRK